MDLSMGWLGVTLVIDLFLLWWANWIWLRDMQLGIFLACVFMLGTPFFTILFGVLSAIVFQLITSKLAETAVEERATLGMVYQNGFLFLLTSPPREGVIMFILVPSVYWISAWIYRSYPPDKRIERVDTAILLFAVVVSLLTKYIIHLYIGP